MLEKTEKVEAYECHICHGIYRGDYEEFLKHQKIPVDTPLPKGLVYKSSTYYHLVIDGGILGRSSELIDFNSEHSYKHKLISFHKDFESFIPGSCSSFELKENLKTGMRELLDERRFREFQRVYECCNFITKTDIPSDKLVRINKELEELVSKNDLSNL